MVVLESYVEDFLLWLRKFKAALSREPLTDESAKGIARLKVRIVSYEPVTIPWRKTRDFQAFDHTYKDVRSYWANTHTRTMVRIILLSVVCTSHSKSYLALL